MKKQEIESGIDYIKQHPKFTKFHDICIRIVLSRRGWNFEGDKLIKIRFEDKGLIILVKFLILGKFLSLT